MFIAIILLIPQMLILFMHDPAIKDHLWTKTRLFFPMSGLQTQVWLYIMQTVYTFSQENLHLTLFNMKMLSDTSAADKFL